MPVPDDVTLDELQRWLRYEQSTGVHTYHQCDCGRQWCRRYECVLCLTERIEAMKAKGDAT